MLGYFFLVLLFLALLSLCFYFGVREWLRPADDSPLPVDVEYVRQENFFGLSFRAQLSEWLKAAPVRHSGESPVPAMSDQPDEQKVRVLESGSIGEGEECREIGYCGADLKLAARVICHKEVYCRGHFVSGAGAQLQAVAADGGAELGAANLVAGWVDAQGSIRLQQGTTVRGRVTSLESIELAPGVAGQYMCAPVIFTSGYSAVPDSTDGPQQAGELPPRPLEQAEAEKAPPAYLRESHCTRLAPDTWLVRGSLNLPAGTQVNCKLVVQGWLSTEWDCFFAADVKAAQVKLGPRNKFLGNLVSGGSLQVAEAGTVGGNLVAESDIWLRGGARVGHLKRRAVVSAGGEVRMEQNVAVHGKVVAGRGVVTL